MLTDNIKSTFKDAAQKLIGPAKRAFMANVTNDYFDGSSRKVESHLGWSRHTVHKGLKELETGFVCLDNYAARGRKGTGSVEWEWLPILKQSLIQTPVQFSRDLYVAEMPGRMGICMPYVVYPINSSRVLVRELFGFDHRVGHFWPLSIMGVVPKLPCPQ